MRLGEIYKTRSKRIEDEDVNDFKSGLTIHKADVIGKTRKGILLTFKETNLQHKCNQTDAFAIANGYGVNDTDEFIGKMVIPYVNEKGMVRIKLPTKKK